MRRRAQKRIGWADRVGLGLSRREADHLALWHEELLRRTILFLPGQLDFRTLMIFHKSACTSAGIRGASAEFEQMMGQLLLQRAQELGLKASLVTD